MESLLVSREIHFLGPSGRIWRVNSFIGGYDDAKVEVMTKFGCGPTHTILAFGHDIQGCVGAYNDTQ